MKETDNKVDKKNPLRFVFSNDTEEKDSNLLGIIHFIPYFSKSTFSQGDQNVRPNVSWDLA